MKISKLFSALMLVGAVAFTACEKAPEPDGPGKTEPQPQDTTTVTAKDATVAEVVELANALEAGASTKEYYRVKGVVSAVQTTAANLVSYGNINFTLMDATGTIGCYYINYLNNQPFTSADQILHTGDTVTVVSQLKSYVNKNTGEATPEMANGYIEAIVKYQSSGEITDITFAEAIAVKDGLAKGATTPEAYRVKGVVTSVSSNEANLTQYGNCNFYIADPTGAVKEEITCWKTNWLENKPFTSYSDVPVKGDTVVVVAPIQNYNGKTELLEGYIESIVRYVAPPVEVDDDSSLDVPAEAISCAEAIAIGKQLADNATSDAVYYIKGVVKNVETSQAGVEQYGNVIFDMVDNLEDTEIFKGYQVYAKDSAKFLDARQIVPGNVIVVKSKIKKYVKDATVTIETVEKAAYIYSTTNTFVPEVVPDPEIPEGTQALIDFSANSLGLSQTDTIADQKTYTISDVTLTVMKGSSTSKPQVMTTMYRMYKNSNFSLSVPEGKNIKYVKINTTSDKPGKDVLSANVGELTFSKSTEGFWNGQAASITFSNTDQVRILKLLVVYE